MQCAVEMPADSLPPSRRAGGGPDPVPGARPRAGRQGYNGDRGRRPMERRSMPVCFTADQYAAVERYAREHGMLNAGQALEKMLESE